MHVITLFAVVVSLFSTALAHIYAVSGPSTYAATSSSKYPLTFSTIDGPISNDDFSVVLGLQFTSGSHPAPSLGEPVKNYNLVALGHSSSADGSFVLKVPLPSSSFSSGSGSYVLTAVVTNAIGAGLNVQLLFFNATFTVSGV